MIDWARIHELREEIGEEGFAEVVEIFLEEVEETLERLSVLGPGPDRSACLHFLKGCGLNLGFVDLAATCRKAELDQAAVSTAEIAATFGAARDQLLGRIGPGHAPAA